MTWIVAPALAAAAVFSLLAATYLHLNHRHGGLTFLPIWGGAWTMLALQASLSAAFATPILPWPWIDVALFLLAGTALLLGAFALAGRGGSRLLEAGLIGLAIGIVTVLAFTAGTSLLPRAPRIWTAAISFLTATFLGAAWIVYRHAGSVPSSIARPAALSFLAWGILQPIVWLRLAEDAGPGWLAALGVLLPVGLAIGASALALDAATRHALETEGRVADEELQRINAQLEASNQLKREFLSNTSHELKTPLTSIIANTEILEYEMCGSVNDEQRRVLANIGRNSQHLLDMISRLLDFARDEEAVPGVRFERVDLRELLDSVAETVRPLAGNEGQRIRTRVGEDLDACYLDGEKIYRVYLNLVENAIKFSSDGEILATADRVGSEIEGTVSDRGIGIPEDRREEIFEAFRQVDASSTRAYEGVGLGLAICRQLIELQGGRIWVESEPGEGSTFRFRLPYRTEPPQATETS